MAATIQAAHSDLSFWLFAAMAIGPVSYVVNAADLTTVTAI